MTDTPTPPRRVKPRSWAAVAVAGLAAAQPALTTVLTLGTALPAYASEAGEAGEAGIARQEDGPTALLTSLGYFEGTYRIAATLYLSGARDLARAHLEESHHAFYDDIAPELAKFHAPGFDGQAAALTDAIQADAGNDVVRAAYDAVLTAMDHAAKAAKPSAADQLMSIKELLALAAAEYEGGVAKDGSIDIAIEYRDSWGFAETARARAAALAAGDDAGLAQAGRDVLAQLDGIDALYPGLETASAAQDASQLAVATGWAEIIALRMQ